MSQISANGQFNKFTPFNTDSMMEGGTINLDVPAVDGIRSRAQSGGSDFGAYKKSGGRIGTSGDWNRQRYEVSSIDPSVVGCPLGQS